MTFSFSFESVKEKIVGITPEEFELCRSILIPKKLRKKQLLLAEGDVCRYVAYVNKGCMRSFAVDKKGVEHIAQFALEGWTIFDYASFINGTPATYFIEALEDSELYLLDKAGREKLVETIPKFERSIRLNLEKNLVAFQFRVDSLLFQNAEERYDAFVTMFPEIMQRVPQHMVASYLGVTAPFLSRIRARKTVSNA